MFSARAFLTPKSCTEKLKMQPTKVPCLAEFPWFVTKIPKMFLNIRTKKVTNKSTYFRELSEIRKFGAHQDSGRNARFSAFCVCVSNRCVCVPCVSRFESRLSLGCVSSRVSCDVSRMAPCSGGQGRTPEPQLAASLCVSRFGSRCSCVSAAFRQQLHKNKLRFTVAVRIAAFRVSRFAAT